MNQSIRQERKLLWKDVNKAKGGKVENGRSGNLIMRKDYLKKNWKNILRIYIMRITNELVTVSMGVLKVLETVIILGG